MTKRLLKSTTVTIEPGSAFLVMAQTQQVGLSLLGINGEAGIARFQLTTNAMPAPSDTVIELHSDGTWIARMGAPL